MKILISCPAIIAFLIISAITVQSQNVLWSEDFEGNWLNNWYAEQGIWEAGVPTSGPGSAFEGENCAATILAGNFPTYSSSRFIRIQSFTIPEASQNPRLRFWHWYHFASNSHGRVQIKEVGTTNWINVSPTYAGTGGGIWTCPLIDLSEYENKNIQIAFYFQSGYYSSPGWYIDEIALITGPTTLVFPEGFESGLGDWYTETGTWEVGNPTSGPGSAYTGDKCAATRLGGNFPTYSNSRLISPPFTMPDSSQNPQLRFWHWYNFASNSSGRVQIKEVGTANWVNVSPTYSGTGGGIWTYPLIDLSEYANKNVQIAFRFESGYYSSAGWYIDDIMVEGLQTVIGENSTERSFNIFPNPFSHSATISFDNPNQNEYSLRVYNLSGVMVYQQGNITTTNIHFERSNLQNGVYIIELKGEDTFRGKMIVK